MKSDLNLNTKQKTKRSIPYIIATRIFQLLVPLVGMVLLVRYLEPVEYGVLALFMAIPGMLYTVFALGYGQYLSRYLPGMETDKEAGARFWDILIRRIISVLAISLILMIFFPYYAGKFQLENYYPHFMVFIIIIVTQYCEVFFKIYFNTRFNQNYLLYLNMYFQIVRSTIIIYGISYSMEFIFFIWGFAVLNTSKFVISAILVFKDAGLPKLGKRMVKLKETDEERKYRRISYINDFGISFLRSDIDRFILSYFSTNIQVAIYALATEILKKVGSFIPHIMFKTVITPAFFRNYDEKKTDKSLNDMFTFIINIDLMVGIIYLGLFIPLGHELLLLFFQQAYAGEAYLPMLIFLSFMIINAIQPGMVVQAIKKPIILLISKISAIVNIAIAIPLAIYYGATGVAFATAFSALLKNYLTFFLVKRYVDIKLPWASILKSILNIALLFTGVKILIWIGINIYLVIVLSLLLFLVINKMIPTLNSYDKRFIKSMLPKKMRKFSKILI
ncbi:MAG: oligosaccharide flippase family protein [Bacteroidetes bacterium]|nr:oligosaccharide flippase family protein [Bacteroidota bacterium]